jgi:hypothetical protein
VVFSGAGNGTPGIGGERIESCEREFGGHAPNLFIIRGWPGGYPCLWGNSVIIAPFILLCTGEFLFPVKEVLAHGAEYGPSRLTLSSGVFQDSSRLMRLILVERGSDSNFLWGRLRARRLEYCL